MSIPTLAQQRAFFETFGFLKLPGLLKNEIDTIIAEFEAVFPDKGLKHDGKKRTSVIPFVDQRPALSALLDHPGIVEAVSNLIGPDFNYVGSDGNYYTGDTGWHRDSLYRNGKYIKVAFYLDPVGKDTGCLRVIPGSHTDEGVKIWPGAMVPDSEHLWGKAASEVPYYPLENTPGDVLIFNHRIFHGSSGGNHQRRMFTMNLGRRAEAPEEMDDLISYVSYHMHGHKVPSPYGKAMVETASPARRVHLTQVPEYWAAGLEHYKLRTK